MKINDKHLVAYGNSPNGIDKEGYLNKRGEVNKGFQRRWFVLKGNLLFYSEKRGEKPVGIIILEDCSVEVSDAAFYSFTVSFFGDRARVYVLSADTETEMITWMKRISTAPYSYAAMVVKELEKRLERLKKNEQELLQKQADESAKLNQNDLPEVKDIVEITDTESGVDKTDNLVDRCSIDLSLNQEEIKSLTKKMSKSAKWKGNTDRNTIAFGNPKSFNNLLTVSAAATKLKNNVISGVRRSKSSENINKLVSKSPTLSPVPPRRKFHQTVIRRKAQPVKIEHLSEPNKIDVASSSKQTSAALNRKDVIQKATPSKSTFYMLHNRYAATIWTAIKEFENEDLIKFE